MRAQSSSGEQRPHLAVGQGSIPHKESWLCGFSFTKDRPAVRALLLLPCASQLLGNGSGYQGNLCGFLELVDGTCLVDFPHFSSASPTGLILPRDLRRRALDGWWGRFSCERAGDVFGQQPSDCHRAWSAEGLRSQKLCLVCLISWRGSSLWQWLSP